MSRFGILRRRARSWRTRTVALSVGTLSSSEHGIRRASLAAVGALGRRRALPEHALGLPYVHRQRHLRHGFRFRSGSSDADSFGNRTAGTVVPTPARGAGGGDDAIDRVSGCSEVPSDSANGDGGGGDDAIDSFGEAERSRRPAAEHPRRRTSQRQSYHSHWKSTTNWIVNRPVGTFESQDWEEALLCLSYWYKRGINEYAVRRSMSIIQRLANEASAARASASAKDSGLGHRDYLNTAYFNGIVNHWQQLLKKQASQESRSNSGIWDGVSNTPPFRNNSSFRPTQSSSDSIPKPLELLHSIENDYSSLTTFNVRTYTMIIDTLKHNSHLSVDMVQRAENAVEQLINKANDPSCPKDLYPDTYLIAAIIDLWLRVDQLDRSMEWLKRINSLVSEQPDKYADRLEPNPVILTSLLRRYVQLNEDGDFEEFLDRLMTAASNGVTDIDVAMYNTVMAGYAKATVADLDELWKNAEQVQRLLERLEAMRKSGKTQHAPSFVTYSIAIHAWARYCSGLKRSRKSVNVYDVLPSLSQSRMAAANAMMLLRKLVEEYNLTGDENVRPNNYVYNTTMMALARSKQPEKVEEILSEMIAQYEAGNTEAKPNSYTYSIVLSAWARHKNRKIEIAEKAERLLETMKSQPLPMSLNDIHISQVLNIWASLDLSRYPEALERAKDLLERYLKEAEEGSDSASVSLGLGSFSAVVAGFARAGRADEAEAVLNKMLNETSIEPNTNIFTSLMFARQTSSDPASPSKVDAMLQMMNDLHAERGFDCKPNVVTYSVAILSWARADLQRYPEAPHKARELLESIRYTKDPMLRPSSRLYSNVVHGYSRAGLAKEAHDLLLGLVEDWEARQRHESLKPHPWMLRGVLAAYAYSDVEDKGDQAEAIFVRWQSQLGLETSRQCYVALLKCWARSGQIGAGERAEAILEVMSKSPATKPDILGYNTVMEAYANEIQMLAEQNVATSKPDGVGDDGELEDDDNDIDRGDLDVQRTKQTVYARTSMKHLTEMLDRTTELYRLVKNPDRWTYRHILRAIKWAPVPHSEKLERIRAVQRQMLATGYIPDRLHRSLFNTIRHQQAERPRLKTEPTSGSL